MAKKRKIIRITVLFFILAFCNNCNMDPENLPVTLIGLDESGKEVHHIIAGKHSKYLGRSLDEVSEESIDVLDGHRHNSPWVFDRLDVGLGVSVKMGFAVIDFSVSTAVRLTFKKKKSFVTKE